jgi:serine/threonine protein kinase
VVVPAGSYPAIPATRSKELRELVDRMLTLDFNKRPSINEVLAAPVVKARIAKFLSATLHVGVPGPGGGSGEEGALQQSHAHTCPACPEQIYM